MDKMLWCLACAWWLLGGLSPVFGAPMQDISAKLAAANENRTILNG